jgi:hypothetical protein
MLFLCVVFILYLYSPINRILIYLIFSYKLGNGIGSILVFSYWFGLGIGPKSIFGLVCNRYKLGIEIGVNLVLG